MKRQKISLIAKKVMEENQKKEVTGTNLLALFEKTNLQMSYRTFKRGLAILEDHKAIIITKKSGGRAKGVQNIITWINTKQLNKICNG